MKAFSVLLRWKKKRQPFVPRVVSEPPSWFWAPYTGYQHRLSVAVYFRVPGTSVGSVSDSIAFSLSVSLTGASTSVLGIDLVIIRKMRSGD